MCGVRWEAEYNPVYIYDAHINRYGYIVGRITPSTDGSVYSDPVGFGFTPGNTIKFNVHKNIILDYSLVEPFYVWDPLAIQMLYRQFKFVDVEEFKIVGNVPDNCLPTASIFPDLAILDFDRFYQDGSHSWGFLGNYKTLRKLSISNTTFDLSIFSNLDTSLLNEIRIVNCTMTYDDDLNIEDVFRPLASVNIMTFSCDPYIAQIIALRTELKHAILSFEMETNSVIFVDRNVLNNTNDTLAQLNLKAPFSYDIISFFPLSYVFRELLLYTNEAETNEVACLEQAFKWLRENPRPDVKIVTVYVGSRDGLIAAHVNLKGSLENLEFYNLCLLAPHLPQAQFLSNDLTALNAGVNCNVYQLQSRNRLRTTASIIYTPPPQPTTTVYY